MGNKRIGWQVGKWQTPEYRCWANMLDRCIDPSDRNYGNYGGRGIAVCHRWMDFACFLIDMGPRPAGMSLDRINNDGNYEPGNCRWASKETQVNNTRQNVFVECGGKRLTVSQWAKELGINRQTMQNRLSRGWSLERATTARKQEVVQDRPGGKWKCA